MIENTNEQTEVKVAQATEVEKINGANKTEVSLGKFKDVSALLDAYNSLQAEFTKRCQRIKELEAEKQVVDKAYAPTETKYKEEKSNDSDEVLKSYLKDLIGAKAQAVILDGIGTGLKTPPSRPKTIDEAGRLAKEMLAK